MRRVVAILAILEVIALVAGQDATVRERPREGRLSLSSPKSAFEFVEEKGKWVRLIFKGKLVWQYNYGVAAPVGAGELNATSGFLHPVWSPNGSIVTDWGAQDHYHHRGIFFAWVKTKWGDLAPDFWNLFAGSGRTRFEQFERLELQPDKAIVIASHVWHAKKGDQWLPVIGERWTITTYEPQSEQPDFWTFDLETELVNITDLTLEIEEYRYGGLGYRGSRDWMDKSKREVLTSEGKTLSDADATDARWVLQGGIVGEKWSGLTIMDHPKNLGFPNRLRVADNFPYVGFAPMRKMSFAMKPNEPMKFRFRFLVHAVKPTKEQIERLWHQFSKSAD
ncbi:MAG: PmoA family protein [Armatimonadetes bacterium]|nr:PmoA family protein [Armatimonadota bacterium]MDW8026757.1 PmoA family protein [Armatimonadota bacterium]